MARRRRERSCGIGGQAVLEGIMMKNKERYAVIKIYMQSLSASRTASWSWIPKNIMVFVMAIR